MRKCGCPILYNSRIILNILYIFFQIKYDAARARMTDRSAHVAEVIEGIEREMELLCVTGVEDRLQENVRPTLEILRNAGIKVILRYIIRLFYTYKVLTCCSDGQHLFY